MQCSAVMKMPVECDEDDALMQVSAELLLLPAITVLPWIS